MTKYLFGSAVQGIQNFIFQTNKLREIVGASDLVSEVCTSLFRQVLEEVATFDEKCSIIAAAGNVKYVFDSETDCAQVVREWPRRVEHFAPGVTVSQAVVRWDEDKEDFAQVVTRLEQNLRTQRSRPTRPLHLGLASTQRSRSTGQVVVRQLKDNYLDAATLAKLYELKDKELKERKTTNRLCVRAFGKDFVRDCEVAYDVEDLEGANSWIAIIHADGNGLGQVVQRIGNQRDKFQQFSKKLDEATLCAAQRAYAKITPKEGWGEGKRIPLRPIVLGGDDLTIICRGDLAVRYTKAFLEAFEKETHEKLGDMLEGVFTEGAVRDRLTACAGIAFVKSSFPFYYGYHLAEEFCGAAKSNAKRKDVPDSPEALGKALPPSCLMFHKVQDSFVEKYEDMVGRELTPQQGTSWQAGPYYLTEDAADCRHRTTCDQLQAWVDELAGEGESEAKEANAVKSHLRRWLLEMHENEEYAHQHMARVQKLLSSPSLKKLTSVLTSPISKGEEGATLRYPLYDVLALHSICYLQTQR